MLQFLPGTTFAPHPVAASGCNAAQFVADETIPDGTNVAPGTTFLKTWRLKNVGSCTWTTSYSAVFVSGSQMGAPATVYLPTSVAPGATVDISVNLTAPSSPGHYRGNWKLRNGSGGLFGVGSSGNSIFWVDIYVNSSSTSGTTYDFVTNYCSALWASGAGGLTCPGTDGNASGFVLNVANPQLENGSAATSPALVVNPQQVAGGYIKAYYPAYTVQAGDHFQSIINCAYNATGCYVNFQLQYQINSGPVHTFWSFNERYDGLYYPVNLDLSSLAGQSVNFILHVADVSGHGTPSGDRAEWVGPRITGTSSIPIPPIPPSPTCNKGAFVSDVTIPDGSVMAPGQAFTKTWEIRNVGSCTWNTNYALIYVFGTPMGVASVVNLPSSVASGATADFSVNMVAPSAAGHYRSYWRFRSDSGVQFGVGSGMVTFFADIYVTGSGSSGGTGGSSSISTVTFTSDSPDPSAAGQSVSVGVTVSGAGGTPTGTVAITGADTNCNITLSGGSGSCNVIFNTTGNKVLTALYSGDSSYASSSATEGHVVAASSSFSATHITADTPDPSIPGQVVAVTVVVTGSGTIPTGTVAITGADSNCTITLAGGTGTCSVTFNTSGAKTLTASYSGNANYVGSVDTEAHTVGTGLATSATTITIDNPNPSTPGYVVVVGATVSGAGIPIPTGTVAITGADNNCNMLLSNGTGSCSVTFNTTGYKTLTATYSGDGNYGPSSGSEYHVVIKGSTTTTITSITPEPSMPGQAVAMNVTVLGGGVTPTGTVAITGADVNCTLTLSGGSGVCSVVSNTTGTKHLIATYSGDSNYLTSTVTKDHSVGMATTITINSDNPDPSTPGFTVDVYFTVTGSGDIPTGYVDISGADIVPSPHCYNLQLSDHGHGHCQVTFNTAGAKVLTITYEGNGEYVGSSATENHTVNKGTTTTTIMNVDPSISDPYASVEVDVNVASSAGVTPTGNVTIGLSGGQTSTCNLALDSSGNGMCNVVFSTAGSFTITATYNGDGNYSGSFGTTNHTVH
jgi:hypothetical protein